MRVGGGFNQAYARIIDHAYIWLDKKCAHYSGPYHALSSHVVRVNSFLWVPCSSSVRGLLFIACIPITDSGSLTCETSLFLIYCGFLCGCFFVLRMCSFD